MNKITGISTFALVMLITGAIDSVRNLPSNALFGSSLIFFTIMSAIFFLVPVALISAELSSVQGNQKSGIYHWVKSAFGEKWAFLAIWLQWINTMVWFPSILSAIAGTLAYLINPALAQNKFYLVSVILITFWSLTIINLKGIKTSVKLNTICTVAGMVIPMLFIVGLAVAWVILGKPMQIHFGHSDLLPSFHSVNSWVSLTAIMTAFLGMELAAVHVKDINNAQKTFPKALAYSVLIIVATMVLGSLAIAVVLPAGKINLVNGVMQAFANFFAVYHIGWMVPVIAIMLVIGNFGEMINWVISPSKGLLQAAQTGYLPEFFKKENKHGVASNLLITQALLVTAICVAFLLMPSVNGSYWLLTALSTQLYMLMYVILFIAAVCLKYKLHNEEKSFVVPGGKPGTWVACLLGLVGCAVTLGIGFFPPDGVNVGGTMHYEIVFSSGILAMILPIIFFYGFKYKKDGKSTAILEIQTIH